MLALRSLLVVSDTAADSADAAVTSAGRSAADVVVINLAAPALAAQRAAARKTVAERIGLIAAAGRPVLVRASSASSGELAADLEAAVCPPLAAVVLAGTEGAQDARDADVLLRKYELRHEMTPGAVRLIPEIDSAAGLQALPAILDAVDRYEAVAINTARMHRDLGLGHGVHDAHDHTMAMVAVTARAAELPWVLGNFGGDHGFIEATRAHEFGAAGAAVHSEASARGVTSLFALDAAEVAAARAVLREWDRLRAEGLMSGTVLVGDEANPRVEPVDRRAMRAARLLVAQADAIAARERIRD